MVQDLFGDYDHHIKLTQCLPALHLLPKEKLMESKDLFMYLLNGLKSSWILVRLDSYYLLSHLPDSHHLLSNKEFVNNVIWSTAIDFSSNPKAMISEGAGLHMKLLFFKCLKLLEFIKVSDNERDMQL